MDQTHVLKLIALAFGGSAIGAIVASLLATLRLRKLTERQRKVRIEREKSDFPHKGLTQDCQ
jgi:predicted acylesterase/phospholipase RssA